MKLFYVMVVFMGSYRDRYIELHTIEWDILHSACRDCEHRKKGEGCQYYFNKCPHGGGEK